MVSREHKRAAFHEKLQLLRSITHSHAVICSITHHLSLKQSILSTSINMHDKLIFPFSSFLNNEQITHPKSPSSCACIQVARMDAQMVKQAVLQAIKTGTKSSDQE
ncbi:hypothetical protein GW17_00022151 [Ensete ventricosum]|nr:hypothetical protein GW17_00022151 [Ensete ventricosum]